MYRAPTSNSPMRNKFSFLRLIQNSFPVFANDSPNDVDPSPLQKDYLFKYQMHQSNPFHLVEGSFFIGGIVGYKHSSPAVYRALKKNGVLSETGEICTGNITKNFANQLATISVHAQRKLVGLLFWWEEEVVRLRLLAEEEAEIIGVLEGLKGRKERDKAMRRELEMLLEGVRRRKILAPSDRGAEGGRGEDELPAYTQ